MRIAGPGITTFDVKVKPNFTPEMNLALNWYQKKDGNYAATDRGASHDYYITKIKLIRWEKDINDFLVAVNSNRTNSSNVITLSNFEETEHIFGADLDYSGTINATVLDLGVRTQRKWKSLEVSCKLQALSPSFTGTPALPNFKWIDVGYNGDQKRTISKYDSYDGTFFYLENSFDSGFFKGTITLTDADMKNFRRYIATQRTGDFIINNFSGVEYPFGPNRTAKNPYPLTCKLIDYRDLGMFGVHWWKAEVTFAEVI